MSNEVSKYNSGPVVNQAGGNQYTHNRKVVSRSRNVGLNFFKTSTYQAHKDVNSSRVQNTCMWFLKNNGFRQWKDSKQDDVLWLSAGLGCGKSVLSKALIDERLVDDGSSTICYFFFKENEEQNSITTAVCALLHQLFFTKQELFQMHAQEMVDRCGEKLKDDFDDLWQLLISAAHDTSVGNVICILDALDECRPRDRKTFIKALDQFYTACRESPQDGSKLKFLVTCRSYKDIEWGFSGLTDQYPTIRLDSDRQSKRISAEINMVMEAKVDEIVNYRGLDDKIRENLKRRFSEVQNPTYLWLHLTLDVLKYCLGSTEKYLLQQIDELPDNVEQAYEAILQRSDGKNEGDTRRLLEIIVAARRPLTVSELDVALEIHPASRSCDDLDLEGEDRRKQWIRDVCGPFVSVKDSRVHLIHKTARDFLLQQADRDVTREGWGHSIHLKSAHHSLAKLCIVYLRFNDFQEIPQRPRGVFWPGEILLPYAVNHWIHHLEEAAMTEKHWLSKASELCEVDFGPFSGWVVYFAGKEGQRKERQQKFTSLYWATKWGSLQIMRFLLDRTEPAVEITEEVIKAAARDGPNGKEMMELLFNRREAEVKITNGAILTAIKNHESGEAVLRLLLPRRGAEIKITSWMLYTAAENKQTREAIMNLLIDHRGPGDIKITGWIADKLARRYPCGDTVWRRLLGPQGAGQLTKEALDVLVQFSSGKVMESALDNPQWGIKITDEMLRTAASNEDHGDDMIRALLRRKDNAAITMTLVQEASKNETTGDAVMEVLLQQKHVQLNLARNEIFAMVRWFNDQVISLLTEHEGVELGIDGQLIESAVNGRHGNAVMKVLLRRTGLACNFSPADFIRILSAFDEEVVRSVLKILGPDVKVTEEVMVAVAQNQIYGLEVMKLLLNYGGDDVVATQNVIQKIAWTRWGNKMMKILLEHKRIPYKVAHDTVIDITKHFDAEVMSGVLEVMGPSFKITEEVVITAVLNVSYAPEVTTLLLDHDANVAFTQNVVKEAAANTQCGFPLMRIVLDQSNNDIRTAESYIHAAAEHHNVNMMYDLLQKSADVELTSNMILDIVKSFPEWVISLLFAQKGAEVPITENVLIAAAMNPTGANVMEFLLGYKEDGLTITEGVIAAAAANQECGEDVIELLFGWTQNNANRIDPTAAAALAEPRPSVVH